jgi:hypothetical protein
MWDGILGCDVSLLRGVGSWKTRKKRGMMGSSTRWILIFFREVA